MSDLDGFTKGQHWIPHPGVQVCNGPLIEASYEFFRAPPEEIGEVIAAHTTLTAEDRPYRGILKLIQVISRPIAIILIAVLLSSHFGRGGDLVIVFGIIWAGFSAFTIVSFSRECVYVGRKGLVRFTLKGDRDSQPVEQRFLFSEAQSLFNRTAHVYINAIIYGGTTYEYWTSPRFVGAGKGLQGFGELSG